MFEKENYDDTKRNDCEFGYDDLENSISMEAIVPACK